mmetsp:Transcript_75760/g.222144  ORF Transcript_75760/g.222144 Transcript_75760/m.222144 type:complete len:359 (-) Transcript_75760:341-1417(-)
MIKLLQNQWVRGGQTAHSAAEDHDRNSPEESGNKRTGKEPRERLQLRVLLPCAGELAAAALPLPQQRGQEGLCGPAEGVPERHSGQEEERAEDLVRGRRGGAQGAGRGSHVGQDHGLEEDGEEHRAGEPQEGHHVPVAPRPAEGLRPQALAPQRADEVGVAHRGGKDGRDGDALQAIARDEEAIADDVHRQAEHGDEQGGDAVLRREAEGRGHGGPPLDGRAQGAQPEVVDRVRQHLWRCPQSDAEFGRLPPQHYGQEHGAHCGDGHGVRTHAAALLGIARSGGQEAQRRRVQECEQVRGAIKCSSRRTHGCQLQSARVAHEGLVYRAHGGVGHHEAEGRRHKPQQRPPCRHPGLFMV